MKAAVILYGPPAAGKDTVTQAMAALDPRFAHYERIKAGPGRTNGYRTMTTAEIEALDPADVLFWNERYGATYVVERSGLDALADQGHVPIVHLGQVEGVRAVVDGYPAHWYVIGLWCSRATSAARLAERGDQQPAERLKAWDATLADVRAAEPALFTLTANTEQLEPFVVAELIRSVVETGVI